MPDDARLRWRRKEFERIGMRGSPLSLQPLRLRFSLALLLT
jgi:hypothetical protein